LGNARVRASRPRRGVQALVRSTQGDRADGGAGTLQHDVYFWFSPRCIGHERYGDSEAVIEHPTDPGDREAVPLPLGLANQLGATRAVPHPAGWLQLAQESQHELESQSPVHNDGQGAVPAWSHALTEAASEPRRASEVDGRAAL